MELTELAAMVEARYGPAHSNPGAGHREAAMAALERAYQDEDPA